MYSLKQAVECRECGGFLEFKKKLYESSLGYDENVDEIRKCEECGKEYVIALYPVYADSL